MTFCLGRFRGKTEAKNISITETREKFVVSQSVFLYKTTYRKSCEIKTSRISLCWTVATWKTIRTELFRTWRISVDKSNDASINSIKFSFQLTSSNVNRSPRARLIHELIQFTAIIRFIRNRTHVACRKVGINPTGKQKLGAITLRSG